MLGMLIVSAAIPATQRLSWAEFGWWCANLGAWLGLYFLLLRGEQPRITWIVQQASRVVAFTRSQKKPLPAPESLATLVFFALLAWNWWQQWHDWTFALVLLGIVPALLRARRRAPFSSWQWTGAALILAQQATAAYSANSWTRVDGFLAVILWWMVTHRAPKREDDALAARLALSRAMDHLAKDQFLLAEAQVRGMLPLATNQEIASTALAMLAAALVSQARLAEATRALEGSIAVDPANEEARKQLDDLRKAQLA
jgi:hypothetical protein